MLSEPKHIFIMRIGQVRYKDRKVYSEAEFETTMDKLQWCLPSNIYVYHFHGDGDRTNPVVKEYPYSPIDIVSLMKMREKGLELWDKVRSLKRQVLGLLDEFAIIRVPENDWVACVKIDGSNYILKGKLQLVPVTVDTARAFVKAHHRHCTAPPGHKFSVGLKVSGFPDLIGVVITSTPKARSYDAQTLEINRVCVHPPIQNACSKLYGAALAIGKIMGYTRALTYTREDEDAASVRAVGFRFAGMTRASKGWSSESRPREQPERYPTGRKKRWILDMQTG